MKILGLIAQVILFLELFVYLIIYHSGMVVITEKGKRQLPIIFVIATIFLIILIIFTR